tara:strand:+ start:503 stop:1843 length:1341 start_codon:yes stop_codon:yes gene_type:complete
MNDESCLTDFNQFRKIVWDNAENDTAKAIIFKIYFKESKDINYINKLLHLCSNECMNNRIFASQLHREKTMQIMWDKAKTKKSKWLLYSCFWNLFRYEDIRNNIPNKLFTSIIKDIDIIVKLNDKNVNNVFFGMLSNMTLNTTFKSKILECIIDLTDMQIKLLINIENQSLKNNKLYLPFFTSLFGLFCNIGVDDNLCDLLIESKIFHCIMKNYNYIFSIHDFSDLDIPMVRNSLSLINNLIDNTNFFNLFLKYELIKTLTIIEKRSDNEHTIDSVLLPNIKNSLDIDNFDDTTNIHLANKFDKILILLDLIVNKKQDINIVDKLGNTILHDALKNRRHEKAALYILCNADINQLNNEDINPITMNKKFINRMLKKKKNIHNSYNKKILKKIPKNYLYEKYLIQEINQYIDISIDIFQIYKTYYENDGIAYFGAAIASKIAGEINI